MSKENESQENKADTQQVEASAVERLIMPNSRVILLKGDNEYLWSICSNPSWGHFERTYSDALLNFANDYVEYKNCGVKHRMIRFSDIDKYIPSLDSFKPEWALDPAKA